MVSVGELEGDIGVDEVVASVEGGAEALLVASLDEEGEEVGGDLALAGDAGGLDGVGEHLVLLGDLDGLLVLLVLLEEVGRDSSELEEIVGLELGGEGDLVKVVVSIDGLSEGLEVLILDVDLVDGLVDNVDVLRLDALEVLHDERNVAGLANLLDDTGVVEVGLGDGEVLLEEERLLLKEEVDGLVEELLVADLLDDIEELGLVEAVGGVLHHSTDSHVVILGLDVEVDSFVPEAGVLAGAEDLGDVHTVPEDLEVLHDLLLAVLGVEDGELGEDAGVGVLEAEALLHDLEDLVVVAAGLVGVDEGLEVVGRDDDGEGSGAGELELTSLEAGLVDLLPGLDGVGLLGGIDGLAVLLEGDVAGGELGVVANAVVESLGGLVHAFVEAAVTDVLDLGDVGRDDELLEISELIGLGEGVDEGSIDTGLLHGLADEVEVVNEGLVAAVTLGGEDDVEVVARILGTDVGGDGVVDGAVVELGLGDLAPDGGVGASLSELEGAVDGLDLVQEDADSFNGHVELLVDGEGFLIALVLLVEADEGELGTIVVVEAVDVLHDSVLGGADTSDDEEVLEVLVVGEVGALEDDSLEKANEVLGNIGVDEGLDGLGDLFGVLGLGEGGVDDLLNELISELVLLGEDGGPEALVLSLDEVAGLILEETVLVGHADEILIASAVATSVGEVGEVGVELLAELTNDGGLVELILEEELLRLLVDGNVDLTDGVVELRGLVALGEAGLEPELEHTESVSALDDLNERTDGALSLDGVEEVVDVLVGGVEVNELADDDGGLLRSDLGDEGLDVLVELVLVEILGHLVKHVESVADVDERKRLRETGLDEELLNLLRIVSLTLAADSLDLLDLAELGGSLNVLELDLRILGGVDDGAEEVEETLSGVVLLEEGNDVVSAESLRVGLTDLDDDLDVSEVAGDEDTEALHAVLGGHGAEVVDEPLGLEHLGVDDDSLDVVEVSVELESLLDEAGSLAELGDLGLIEVGHDVGGEDSLGDLGVALGEVDLEDTGLDVAVLRAVTSLLEDLQEDAGGLLGVAHGEEGVGNALGVDELGVGVGEHLGEVLSALRIALDQAADEVVVVRGVVVGLGVLEDLLVETLADEGGNDLVVGLGLEVDGGGELVILVEDITESLGAGELVLLEPVLDEVLLALVEDGSAELDGLDLVKLAELEEGHDVLEEGRLSAGHGRNGLETAEGGLVTEEVGGGVEGDLGGGLVVTSLHGVLELRAEDVVSAGEAEAGGELKSEVLVLEGVEDEGDEVVLVHVDLEDLTLLGGDAEDTAVLSAAGDEDGVGGETGSEEERTAEDVEHVDVTELGHDEGDGFLLVELEGDGEISRSIGSELEGDRGDLEALRIADLHAEESAGGCAVLLLNEDEDLDGGLALGGLDGAETSGVAEEVLGLLVLNRVELDVSGNGVVGALLDADEEAPLAVGGNSVVDDLRAGKVGKTVEDLLGGGLALNGPVEDTGLGDDGDGLVVDPSPVGDLGGVGELEGGHLGLHVEVEDLELSTLAESNDSGDRVHDSSLGAHGLTSDLEVLLGINDSERGGGALLTDADVLVRDHGDILEVDAA